MSDSSTMSTHAVAEVQGLYGSYVFPEKLLQKLWARGDFDQHSAKTLTGARVEIVHPGKWNSMGGPDFLGARLRFDNGPLLSGDIEVHLREEDWKAHGHGENPAYAAVILHVVLFPPNSAQTTQGDGERRIPVLALLPLLLRALEEYAADEAVERLANRPSGRIVEELGLKPAMEIARILAVHSRRRWMEKVQFASIRVRRLGWIDACHHAALETLGFRFNRAPMLRCAGRWPLAEWASSCADPDEAYAAEMSCWSLQGVRPANHPRRRLRQYAAWVTRCPKWPELLRAMFAELAVDRLGILGVRSFRREHDLGRLKRRILDEVCAGEVGGPRLDNLVCDAFLPLFSAEGGRDLHATWHHWYPGDMPPLLVADLRQIAIHGDSPEPMCHGEVQGVLGWLLADEKYKFVGTAPVAAS